jgi:DNA-binding MarR family transcriptional regulator
MTSGPQLDAVLVDPTRLSVVATLAGTSWAEFGFVRDAAAVSVSALSKQVSTLERHGYVEVRKGYVGKRPRTWLALTPAGRSALRGHVQELEQIVHRLERLAGQQADAAQDAG